MVLSRTFNAGEGKYKVSLLVTFSNDGMVCQLYGGEKPHVGAVVLSLPRPSLRNNNQISCNSSVLPLLGHKEDELAKPIAENIAKHFNQPVVMVAGIHINDATEEDIRILATNCWHCADHLISSSNKNIKSTQ